MGTHTYTPNDARQCFVVRAWQHTHFWKGAWERARTLGVHSVLTLSSDVASTQSPEQSDEECMIIFGTSPTHPREMERALPGVSKGKQLVPDMAVMTSVMLSDTATPVHPVSEPAYCFITIDPSSHANLLFVSPAVHRPQIRPACRRNSKAAESELKRRDGGNCVLDDHRSWLTERERAYPFRA